MKSASDGQAIVDEIVALYEAHGSQTYGEGVTTLEHSLQTAGLARAEGAEDALVVAALLHDIRHFLELPDDSFGYHRHAEAGGAWLAARLPAGVSETVRLHVAAKRYLCAVEPGYSAALSAASAHSLAKQGGPMTSVEAIEFARSPFADGAVRLRRWDDRGKVDGLDVPPLSAYLATIARLAR